VRAGDVLAFRQPPGPLQFARPRAMDAEHVRSGAALEGRPAYRHNPGGTSLPGVNGEVAAPAPQPQHAWHWLSPIGAAAAAATR
jgi:hypothetical protein